MFQKKAWLVGLYTVDVDARVADLGYSIVRVLSTLQMVPGAEVPELIVFTNALGKDCEEMEVASKLFPDSLVISLPVNRFFLEELIYSGERSAKRSVARLTSTILERQNRWDN